ncbi:hypothetical protein ACJJTC_001933 [Scirpophaga incertulas]
MNAIVVFASALIMAVGAQEFVPPQGLIISDHDQSEIYPAEQVLDSDVYLQYHPRFRRDVTWNPSGVTVDRTSGNNRVFGSLGSNDNGLFGKAGVDHTIFNDARGKLNAQAHGTRTLGPYGGTSEFGGALNWKNDNAAASFDVSKQIHGPTSWSAAAGGRWPVGKNGNIGLDGTASRINGVRDYGAQGVFNYRF